MDEETGETTHLDMVFLPRAKRSVQEILPEVKKRMATGGKFITDGWKAYPKCAEECGLTHQMVNHSESFKSKEGFHTNNVEGKLMQDRNNYL